MPNLNYGTSNWDNGTQNGTQDEIQEQVVKLLLSNPKITRKDIAGQLNISVRTLQRILNDMPNVCYVGRGANGYWMVEK